MKKLIYLLDRLYNNRKFNLFIIISFIIFATLDLIAKYYLSFTIDVIIIIAESLRFIGNCKKDNMGGKRKKCIRN